MPTALPTAPSRPAARTRPRTRRGHRTTALALAGGLLTLGAPLLTATPAAAHDRLQSTDPADGAVVEVAPEQVVLTMSATPVALGTQVQVTGPDGSVVSAGDPRIVDTAITTTLTGDRPAGTYEVQWRVTSSDGHPISGGFSFTASAAATPSAPAATASPEGTPSQAPSEAASQAPSEAASPATVDPATAVDSEGDRTLIAVGVAAVLVVGGIGGVIGYRRRRG
ncbi:copper resistance CopC family protein [Kineococcus sp. SYSU DK001]|uniref:copper resistance CopC family protein n=1 Tax=Kineococcus sp. SYSU DK001 TaxID=3383122 RepID=UPI003D7CE6A3